MSHTVQAFAFAALSAFDQANLAGSRFCTVPCTFRAAAQLPAGAVLTSLELAACDSNAAAGLTARLIRTPAPEGTPEVVALAATGDSTATGCGFLTSTPVAHVVDNFGSSYFVIVDVTGTSDTTRFQAVQPFYNLQVSPAPAFATFDDVPTGHPFFAFVEALFAAGITTACSVSPPLYCPDSPITRGQMAAFMSRALGLQFSP